MLHTQNNSREEHTDANNNRDFGRDELYSNTPGMDIRLHRRQAVDDDEKMENSGRINAA
jgi:hypothetical protein